MRNSSFAPWALAAAMAVALPGSHPAWAAAGNAPLQLLKAQLPEGVTLASATTDQTANALKAAVTKRPEMATTLTEAAILAKTPKQGRGTLPCPALSKIVKGALDAAPRRSNDIVQMALSLHPECADSLDDLVRSPRSNAPDGFNNPSDEYGGFGVGFGIGFPGSPGFVGSPPSGAIALPPSIVTSVLNG